MVFLFPLDESINREIEFITVYYSIYIEVSTEKIIRKRKKLRL